MQITEQQHSAANAIIELIASDLGKKRAVHPGTAIASCARLAGSFMFRSFNHHLKNLPPGSAILSEVANEKIPELINVMVWTLENLEVSIDTKKLENNKETESNLNFLDTLNRLQNKAATIMNQNKLNFEQMAFSCAMATAFIIKECQKDLDPERGFNTAVFSFIEGCKTYPPEINSPTGKKKGIFSFWKSK